MDPKRRTKTLKPKEVVRSWYVVDAEGKALGRLASQVARVLRGKQKPTYSPHLDGGDFVIVVNASKVALTGRKPERKVYQRYSGYPGGLKTVTAGALRDSKPERLFRYAVGGMLPKGPLGRRMLRKLKVYGGSGHPHGAQQPQPLEVRA